MMFLMNAGNRGAAGGASSSSGGAKKNKGDPEQLAKQWKRNLQKESRRIDRDITNIKRQEQKAATECKALAKKGRMSAARILAKEIASTRKAVERMYTTKAQLNSVAMNLQTAVATMKLQGAMSKSAEVMTSMNKLVNVREIQATMMEMAREMERTGLVDEIVGDAMDSMDSEGIDAAADAEVDRIVEEITQGILSPAGAAPIGKDSTTAGSMSAEKEGEKEGVAEEDTAEQDKLMARLADL